MKWLGFTGMWLACSAIAVASIFKMPQPSGYVVGALVAAIIGSIVFSWTE